jgi:hypothetical protein
MRVAGPRRAHGRAHRVIDYVLVMFSYWSMTHRTLLELAHTRCSILVVCHKCRHQGLIFPVNIGPRYG